MPRLIFLLLLAAVQAETNTGNLALSYLIKSFLLIVLLLAFMYYWYRYLLPKIQAPGNLPGHLLVREKLVLELGTALYVLEIQGKYKLLVISNKQTSCYDLSAKNLRYLPPEKKDFAGYLAEFLNNKDNKKGRKNVKK